MKKSPFLIWLLFRKASPVLVLHFEKPNTMVASSSHSCRHRKPYMAGGYAPFRCYRLHWLALRCKLAKHILAANLSYLGLAILLFGSSALCGQVDLIWDQDRVQGIRIGPVIEEQAGQMTVSKKSSQASIIGEWIRIDDSLVFRPLLPFTEGTSYTLSYKDKVVANFRIPVINTPSVTLTAIYPVIDTVPENLLKVYLVFSGSMGEQHSEDFLFVTDNRGDTLHEVFLPLRPELWNLERDRLTLWLDPGRIKRGLLPNQDKGKPLSEGISYQILVSRHWKDQRGQPLISNFQHEFVAGAPDRSKPAPNSWQLHIPKEKTRDKLQIDFQEALDVILVKECLHVFTEDALVDGSVKVNEQGTIWQFIPDRHWSAGTYRLQIESRLEDLAGNNLNRLFDENFDHRESARSQTPFYELIFTVGARN